MPIKRIDLSGQRFGALVAVAACGVVRGSVLWRCKCDCGKERIALIGALNSGQITHCGCRIGGHTNQYRPPPARPKRTEIFPKPGGALDIFICNYRPSDRGELE